MQAPTVEDMSTAKKILLVLSCAVMTSLIVFSTIRVIALTGRVAQLENIVSSRQESSVSQPISSIHERIAPPDGTKHKVSQVVDGDTVKIETESGPVTVRIIGIDTPETVHPFKPVELGGQDASNKAKELLEGQIVTIHYDPDPKHGKWDSYERLLVYLDLPDGRDFGLVMIQEGSAKAYPDYPFSRQELYLEAEQVARQEKVGLWAVQIEPNKPVLP